MRLYAPYLLQLSKKLYIELEELNEAGLLVEELIDPRKPKENDKNIISFKNKVLIEYDGSEFTFNYNGEGCWN